MRSVLIAAVAALLLTAATPARADEVAVHIETGGMTITAVTPLSLELDSLQTAFDRIVAGDPTFAEARAALLRCVGERTKAGGLAADTPTTARASVLAALEGCASQLGVTLPRYGLASYYGMAGIGQNGGPPTVSCGNAGADPRRGAYTWAGWRYSGFPYSNEPGRLNWPNKTEAPPELIRNPYKDLQGYKDAAAAAQQAWREYTQKFDQAALDPGNDAKLKEMDEARKRANDALRARDGYRPHIVDNDDGKGPPPGTGTARPDPLVDQGACGAIAQQIAECARDGWRSTDCQRLKRRLQGCGYRDEDVIDPVQMQDASAAPCERREVTAEEAEMLLRQCQSRMLFGPEGGSPCGPGSGVSATLNDTLGWFCMGTGDQRQCHVGGGNPCGGSLTQPDPDDPAEGCQAHATLIQLQPGAAALIAGAFAKLGGPWWTPPGSDPPPPGGPDPGGPRG